MNEQIVYFRIVGPKDEVYTFGKQVSDPVYSQENGELWILAFKSKDEKKDEYFWYAKMQQIAPHCQCYFFNESYAYSNDIYRKYFTYDYITRATVGKRTPSRLWRAFSQCCVYTSKADELYMKNHFIFHSYWRAENLKYQLQLFLNDERMDLPALIDTFKYWLRHYRDFLDFHLVIWRVRYVIGKQQEYLLKDWDKYK